MHSLSRGCLLTGTLLFFGLGLSLQAQKIYPSPSNDAPSSSGYFIENAGQVVSEAQSVADALSFYSWGMPGTTYYTTSKYFLSATVRNVADTIDTIHRMDFAFGNSANNVDPVLLEASTPSFRYYQHNGTFDDLDMGKRLVYQDVYTDIDVHFHTNANGEKMSIVFENGSDPVDFELLVSGYDDIIEVQNYLVIHKAGVSHIIPEAVAYEVDDDDRITLLTWNPQYEHDGNGNLTFSNLGSWDANKTLIFEFGVPVARSGREEDPPHIKWCTLFGGGNNTTEVFDLQTDNTGNLYAAGTTQSPDFPASNTVIQNDLDAGYDLFFAKFNASHVLEWATYMGGSGQDGPFEPFRFDLKSNNSILAVTETRSSDFPMVDPGNGAHFDDQNTCEDEPCLDAVIIEITAAGGLTWSTYYGNFGDNERLRSVVVDDNDDFYVVGIGTYDNVNPGGGAYFNTSGGGRIAKFNASRDIDWSTSFGGPGTQLYDCALTSSGHLVVTGFTSSSSLPVFDFDAGTTDYYQPTSNGGFSDGLIAEFDTDHAQVWCTYFGGDDSDKAWDIDVSASDDVIISGHTLSTLNLDVQAPAGAFLQSSFGGAGFISLNTGDGFFARFDGNRELNHCSYFGDNSADQLHDITFHDDYVLGVGASGSANDLPFPAMAPSNLYVEDTHKDGNNVHQDGFVIALDELDQDLHWTTFLGVEAPSPNFMLNDFLYALDVYNQDKLYVGGSMIGANGYPYKDPGNGAYFQNTTGAGPEGCICLFDISGAPLGEAQPLTSHMSLYPNPSVDRLNIRGFESAPLMIAVYDLQGRLVIEPHQSQGTLDISGLGAGTYIVQLNQNDRTENHRFIKQ